jgi:hypothetical protein
MQEKKTYFFMMMYLNALPMVWPSSINSNDAAVSVDPGSYICSSKHPSYIVNEP